MKRVIIILFVLLLLLPAAHAELSLTALNVGKADALILRSENETWLIDTGLQASWGVLSSALQEMGITSVNGVILTHADKDHAGGLTRLAQSDIAVGGWYASAFCSESENPAAEAAAQRGAAVTYLQAGDVIPSGDMEICVLAPFKADEKDENNNSLVLRAASEDGVVLLTGDMEPDETAALLASGAELAADILKVPYHGDAEAADASFIAQVQPKAALISTDSYARPGTPDPDLLALLEDIGAETLTTQDAELGVRASVSGGSVTTEYVSYTDQKEAVSCRLEAQAKPDYITIIGPAGTDVGGWYLLEEYDGEMLIFPAGTVIPASGNLTVFSRESVQTGTLFWDDKNVLKNKKQDSLTLYDSYGRCVDTVSVNDE